MNLITLKAQPISPMKKDKKEGRPPLSQETPYFRRL